MTKLAHVTKSNPSFNFRRLSYYKILLKRFALNFLALIGGSFLCCLIDEMTIRYNILELTIMYCPYLQGMPYVPLFSYRIALSPIAIEVICCKSSVLRRTGFIHLCLIMNKIRRNRLQEGRNRLGRGKALPFMSDSADMNVNTKNSLLTSDLWPIPE